MLNFCSNCGHRIEDSKPNFCPKCGEMLSKNKSFDAKNQDKRVFSVNILGTKFEECVESILNAKGLVTKRRLKIRGKSGAQHEIDIIAKKDRSTLFVECKNWRGAVGKEQLQKFHSTLQDLAQIGRGIFASYGGFTSDAEDYASYYNIERWDPDFLKEELLVINAGRAQYARGEQKIKVKNALPLTHSFLEVSKLNLHNNICLTTTGLLSYHPYFIVSYSYQATVKDPIKKTHKLTDTDKVFIDGLDSSVLNSNNFGLSDSFKMLISKQTRVQSKRNEHLIRELKNFGSLIEYDVSGEEKYEVRILEPTVGLRTIIRTAKEYIIEKNTQKIKYKTKDQENDYLSPPKIITYVPKSHQIIIKCTSLVNVPRFDIRFISGYKEYAREILASSGTVLKDTIKYCPNHSQLLKKEASAVCEVCGDVLCSKHISQCPVCKKWLCEEHGTHCESCHKLFCTDHISLKCDFCGHPLCVSCQVVCNVCGRPIGEIHFKNCNECGKLVCPDCRITKGLIRKKTYCKTCNS